MSHLDQMTQQNSALVEESAAAATSMREQAPGLAQTVAVFRLDDAAQGYIAAPKTPSAPVAKAPVAKVPAKPAVKAPAPVKADKPAASAAKLAVPAKAIAGKSEEGEWESF
jgi:methyl-accepting chemotaxis protein